MSNIKNLLVLSTLVASVTAAYPISVAPGPSQDLESYTYCGEPQQEFVGSNQGLSCSYNGATVNLGVQISLLGTNGFSMSFEQDGSLNSAASNGTAAFYSYLTNTIAVDFPGSGPVVIHETETSIFSGFSSSDITGSLNGQTITSSTAPENIDQTFDYASNSGLYLYENLAVSGSVSSGADADAIATTLTFQAFEPDGVTPAAILFAPEPNYVPAISALMLIAGVYFKRHRRHTRSNSSNKNSC